MTVRTRFAPSPTGFLHIGGVRTALFCWLYAKKHDGEFVLRIEDTDRERSTKESVQVILDGMEWLGLDWDQGPYYQSDRFDKYRETIDTLLEEGKAYRCYCTKEELDEMREAQRALKEKPRYDGRCRERTEPREGVEPVIRFRNPQRGAVVINDLVRGKVTFNNTELDDLIIARSDGSPTYNLTVVVDDMEMGISHVIRGDDHMNNTPRQINIMEALGGTPPLYGHLPMILGDDGSRLSKRHGAVNVLTYRDDGYLPEAVLNYLVRLGWAHGDQEIFSIDEMIEKFDISDVNKSASTFNPDKLQWLNQHYIKEGEPQRLAGILDWHLRQLGLDPESGPDRARIVESQQERAKTMKEMAENSRFFFEEFEEYDEKAARKNLKSQTLEGLKRVREALAEVDDWKADNIHSVVVGTAETLELKLGKIAQPIRVAVSGGPVSPPIDQTLELLGQDRTLKLLDRAISFIESKEETES